MGNDPQAVRVGLLTASLSRAGAGVSEAVRRLAQEQMRLPGVRIEVFGIEDEWTGVDRITWNGFQFKVAPVWGPRWFGFAPALVTLMAKARLDLLHVQGLWMYTSVACLRWARGNKPYVVSPQGMLDPWALQNSASKKRVAALLYENAHLRGARCIHAVCQAEAEAIRVYGLRNPIAVIPNGVDLPDQRSGGPAPWHNVFPQDVRVLLFLGRLHPKKNVVSLLRAWAELEKAAEAGGWRLVIAGWDQGGYSRELELLAQNLGIQAAVWFSGPLFGENKDAALRSAAAFVLPSLSEGLPVAVLEAWAYRLPVLMSRECNLPEGFTAGAAIETGTAPERIAEGLRQLFAMSEGHRRNMGERGRQLAEARFSWQKIAQQMKAVYEWVLDLGERPKCISMM